MFYPDVPAEQYEILLTISGTLGTVASGNSYGGEEYITYGADWDPTPFVGHGIYHSVRNFYDGALAQKHIGYLSIPALNIFMTTGILGGWVDPLSSKLELDDELLVGTCDSKDFSWTELRWKVDGTLYHTEGAQSFAVPIYDERKNRFHRNPIVVELAPINTTPVAPSCPTTPSGVVVETIRNSTVTKGWRHDSGAGWINEACAQKAVVIPGSTSGANCANCVYAISPAGGADCYNTTCYAEIHRKVWDTYVSTINCPCPTNLAIIVSIDQYLHKEEIMSKSCEFTVAPTNKGLLNHITTGTVTCLDLAIPVAPADTTITNTADAFTYCELFEWAAKSHGEKWCYYVSGLSLCPIGIGDPSFESCLPFYEQACYHYEGFRVEWEPQPCDQYLGVSYDVYADDQHAVAIQRVTGTTIGVSQNNSRTLQFTYWAHPVTCDWLCIRWDHRKRLILWTEEAGAVNRYHITAQGRTISAASVIDAANAFFPVGYVGDDGRVYEYWIRYVPASVRYDIMGRITDANANVIVATFTVKTNVAKDALWCGMSVKVAGKPRVVLYYKDNDNQLYYITSTFGVINWSARTLISATGKYVSGIQCVDNELYAFRADTGSSTVIGISYDNTFNTLASGFTAKWIDYKYEADEYTLVNGTKVLAMFANVGGTIVQHNAVPKKNFA